MPNPQKKPAVELIFELFRDPDRKSLAKIAFELIYVTFYHRRSPHFYFSRYLFKKERKNINDYFPDSYLDKIKPLFNDHDTRDILENKLFFSLFFSQFNICLPKILMYNNRKMFVVGDKVVKVSSMLDFKVLLEDLISKKLYDGAIFIKKTSWSYGGDKIFKIFPGQLNVNSTVINDLYPEVINSEFLFQDTVKQHGEMDKINPSCLNTLRIDTFMDKEGKIEVISAYLRTSVKNLHVDNISAGGCRIPVDLESGRLGKKGFSTLQTFGVKLPEKHPVTNMTFEGFCIPYFSQVKEMVIKAAGYIPSIRLVGWDVGIGENGPVLIEGNSNYSIQGNDLTYGGYRTNPVFKKVLAEYKILKRLKSAV